MRERDTNDQDQKPSNMASGSGRLDVPDSYKDALIKEVNKSFDERTRAMRPPHLRDVSIHYPDMETR